MDGTQWKKETVDSLPANTGALFLSTRRGQKESDTGGGISEEPLVPLITQLLLHWEQNQVAWQLQHEILQLPSYFKTQNFDK